MEDIQILDLYFARDERAILESNLKYGGYCHCVANRILNCEEDAEVSLNLLGASYAGHATVTTLKGERMNSCNTFEQPDAVLPTEMTDVALDSAVTVPAAGVVTVRVAIA